MTSSVGFPAAAAKRRKAFGIIAGVGALLFFLVPIFISAYTDFTWFSSVDAQGVFTRVIATRVVLFLVFGALGAAIIWAAAFFAYKRRPPAPPELSLKDLERGVSPLEIYRNTVTKNLRPILILIPGIAGLISGFLAQNNWQSAQLLLNSNSFGVQDPQFQKDLGFYAFQLPFINFSLSILGILIIAAFAVNLMGHYLLGTITSGNPRTGEKLSIGKAARQQLAIIAGIFMLYKAVDYWFERYELLNGTHPTFTGGSYTDINALLPAKILLLIISIFVAAMFFASLVLKDLRIPALAVVLMVVSSAAIGFGWPAAMEQFSVAPNRAAKEREYIARNIEATRYAYNITEDTVTYERNWGSQDANAAEEKKAVGDDTATISNIRLLDPDVLSATFTQQQQLKNFYGFPDQLAIDRYEVDGSMRDYVVAARELDPNSLTGSQTDWINRHTVYTHGNGFIAAPANKVDEVARDAGSARGGYPVYTVADLQSQGKGQGGELNVDLKQPRIYFGPVIASSKAPNSDYAIVGDNGSGTPQEYDADGQNYSYTGTGGVGIGNPIHRALFAARFESMKLLLSDAIGPDSKILFERDPRERVHKVAPWLTTDSKTYPVVVDGRIKWIVDGYTTLADLPYAQRTQLTSATEDTSTPDGVSQSVLVNNSVSYIRNSVKAVVDAYDGSVDLYAFDESDPVLKTWQGAFPGIVKPRSELSDELVQHVRYPEDMFKVQRELISKYHVDDPSVFFTGDSFWSVPLDPSAPQGRQDKPQPPYYVVAADPVSNKSSFQLITPFRGLRRDFLAAHMTVTSDPDNYGKIYIRALPTDTQTQGPRQAQDTMMSSEEISRERTLLEGTTELRNGNLLTLPVGDGQILYVEPVYSQRKNQDSAFPKLLRVLVSYNSQVGYAPTISEALQQVGISSKATVKIQEAEGNAEAATAVSSEEKKEDGSDSAEKKDTHNTDTGAVTPPSMDKVRSAMDKVNETRRSGSYEEFGKALDELDKAVAEYQATQGS